MWLLLVIIMGASGPQEVIPIHAYHLFKDCQNDVTLFMSNPEKKSNVSAGCLRLEGLTIT